ncbi:uncharacterized protein LOC118187742 [Stegodyphus dumicola]|uniref:uncharacterized protein LOC118187742 n=1 Tax=Stegodyphus dumicola TaxID=202533 RepID=UPI0015A8FF3D|nr:uncharacterized protein LOC118187742 [Stegodyphus dumicola]
MHGTNWGLNPHITKILLQTVITKIVTYGAAIWALPMTERKKKILTTIQRQFTLNITRAFQTAPNSALDILAGTTPLHLEATYEAIYSTISQLQDPITHEDISYDPQEYETKPPPYNRHPATPHTRIKFTPITNSQQRNNTSTIAYTDGSKIDDKVGCGVYIPIQNNIAEDIKWKGFLKNNNTVFQAELAAIKYAIAIASENNISNLLIKTDSQAALLAIKDPNNRSPIAFQINQDSISSPINSITIEWIKGHNQIEGNDIADNLAKEAALNQESFPVNAKLPTSYLKNKIKQQILNIWQREWDNTTTGRRTHEIFPTCNNETKSTTASLTSFLTEHGPYPTYFYKRNLSNTEMCICGETGNADHYHFSCALTQELHIRSPSTITTAFKRMIVKLPHLITAFNKLHNKLNNMGLDLCSVSPSPSAISR